MIIDINSVALSLHGIALWCSISGVICVIDVKEFTLHDDFLFICYYLWDSS